MSRQYRRSHQSLLPYATILAASEGDAEAISSVLEHYKRYITRLSVRLAYDPGGHIHFRVDEAMRRRLEIKLIAGILAFRAA